MHVVASKFVWRALTRGEACALVILFALWVFIAKIYLEPGLVYEWRAGYCARNPTYRTDQTVPFIWHMVTAAACFMTCFVVFSRSRSGWLKTSIFGLAVIGMVWGGGVEAEKTMITPGYEPTYPAIEF